MTDKERIEKFLVTLKRMDNMLTTLKEIVYARNTKGTIEAIDSIKESINYVIDANADEVNIDNLGN